jgi:hypothetical protein
MFQLSALDNKFAQIDFTPARGNMFLNGEHSFATAHIQMQSPPPLNTLISCAFLCHGTNSNPSFSHCFFFLFFCKLTTPFASLKLEIPQTQLTVLFQNFNMKFLSSSPSFSSSSSSASFDPNMCNSKSATAGCLAGILRRILCSGNLPTHPSDQLREADSLLCDKDQELKAARESIERFEASATPGIVARLMGLESMPEIDSLLNSNSKPNSISRSRSMNYADHLVGFDPMQAQHRRVKSTLSFREMPTFLELENENFLILSFETGSEHKESRSKGKKSETGFGELKQRREERCKNMENRAERVSEKKKKKEKKKNNNNNNKGCQEANKKVLNDLNNGKSKGSSITRSPSKNSHEKPYVSPEAVKTSKPVNHKEVVNGRKLSKRKKTSLCVVQKTESECSSEDSSPVSVLDFGHFLTDPEAPISGLFTLSL